MGLGMEGELMSPLLMAPVHIDPSCLHPDLLTEVQHVVIAREQLLLHLNQVIGRGQSQKYFTIKIEHFKILLGLSCGNIVFVVFVQHTFFSLYILLMKLLILP